MTGWTDERAWASQGSWSRSTLEQRIAACTMLLGTDLKRFVRRLLARELLECEVLDRVRAESAIHILESHGRLDHLRREVGHAQGTRLM